MGPTGDYRKGDRFGVRDARGRLVLDARAARDLNEIRAELRRLDRFAVAAPLEYASDASGRRWGLARPLQVYAKLSGTGSPYSWAEATRSAAGVSSLVTGGRTGTAYEANGVTGLTGKYATLDWTAAGDWRFQAIRDGAGGGGSTTPGFSTCCANSLPSTVSISFAFRSGTNSATYFHQIQNQTLTYYPNGSFPPQYPDPFGGLSGRYISPTFGPDDFGQTDYYALICTSGQITLAFGQAGSAPVLCCTFPATSCSPFLAGGQPNTGTGGGSGSCFQAVQPPPGGGGVANYGTDPADIITVS